MADTYEDLDAFWPFYVRQHSRPATRALHFLGTSLGLACLSVFLALQLAWLLPLGLGLAYGCAWAGHFLIERNRPATFRHPWLSIQADLRMYRMMWRGQMW